MRTFISLTARFTQRSRDR